MKKILSLMLVLIFALSLVACGGVDKSERILYKDVDLLKVVELGEYKGIKLDTASDEYKKAYETLLTDDVINNSFHSQEAVKEGTIKKGDIANIDYKGVKDGVAFEGGTAKAQDLTIGSNSFIAGFEDGLVGVKVGETVDLNLKFPEDYHSEDLKGAAVVFTVKVNSIKPALTPEEYYKDLGFESVEKYFEDVNKKASNDFLRAAVQKVSKVKEYPEKDVEYLYTEMKKSIEKNLKNQYNMGFADYIKQMGQTEEQFKNEAIESQIKPMMDSQMIVYAILDKEGIAITKKDVDEKIKEIVKQIGNSEVTEEQVVEYYGRYNFETMVADEKAMDFLYENANVSK